MRTVTVVYQREQGNWLARMAKAPRAQTYGRSLAATRRNMHEVIYDRSGLDVGEYRLVERFPFRPNVAKTLGRVADARGRLARVQRETNELTRQAAGVLVYKEGLSLRDASEVLGLSFQRVHQLVR